jgi:hypothetical protein
MKLASLKTARRFWHGGGCLVIVLQGKKEAIRCRAPELYLRGEAVEGRDVEKLVAGRAENPPRISHSRGFAAPSSSTFRRWSTPGNTNLPWRMAKIPANGTLAIVFPVRLVGDKLYPRRLNGRELQTTIVNSIVYKTNPPPTGPPTPPTHSIFLL